MGINAVERRERVRREARGLSSPKIMVAGRGELLRGGRELGGPGGAGRQRAR